MSSVILKHFKIFIKLVGIQGLPKKMGVNCDAS